MIQTKEVVKAVIKYTWSIPLIFIMAMSCTENNSIRKEDAIIKKIEIEDGFFASERPWGISDGIKVIKGYKTEYFVFDIESPPGHIREMAEVRFTHRIDSLDSVIYQKQLSYTIDSLGFCPFYKLNTLDVFNVNNQYGAYFYTYLSTYPYGIDVYELVMWVYYNERLYKFFGTIPTPCDWSWDETYSFHPDERLKNESQEAYQQIITIWNRQIEMYKKRYNDY